MSKLLGISLVFGAAALGTAADASAGYPHCGSPTYYYYYVPGQPPISAVPPAMTVPAAPPVVSPAPVDPRTQAPGTGQTRRSFSYEPGADPLATTPPPVPTDSRVPAVRPYAPANIYSAPSRPARSSRPSYLDGSAKMRGRFGR